MFCKIDGTYVKIWIWYEYVPFVSICIFYNFYIYWYICIYIFTFMTETFRYRGSLLVKLGMLGTPLWRSKMNWIEAIQQLWWWSYPYLGSSQRSKRIYRKTWADMFEDDLWGDTKNPSVCYWTHTWLIIFRSSHEIIRTCLYIQCCCPAN